MALVDSNYRKFSYEQHKAHIANIYDELDNFFAPPVAPKVVPVPAPIAISAPQPASSAVAVAAPEPEASPDEGQSSSGSSKKEKERIAALVKQEAAEALRKSTTAKTEADKAAKKLAAADQEVENIAKKMAAIQKEIENSNNRVASAKKQKAKDNAKQEAEQIAKKATSAQQEAQEAAIVAASAKKEAEEAEQKAVAAHNEAKEALEKARTAQQEVEEIAEQPIVPVNQALRDAPIEAAQAVIVQAEASPVIIASIEVSPVEEPNINALAEYLNFLTSSPKFSLEQLFKLLNHGNKGDRPAFINKLRRSINSTDNYNLLFSVWLNVIGKTLSVDEQEESRSQYFTTALNHLAELVVNVNQQSMAELSLILKKIRGSSILSSRGWYDFLSNVNLIQAIVNIDSAELRVDILSLLAGNHPVLNPSDCYNLFELLASENQRVSHNLALCRLDAFQLYLNLNQSLLISNKLNSQQKKQLVLQQNVLKKQTLVEQFLGTPTLKSNPQAMQLLLNHLIEAIKPEQLLSARELFSLLEMQSKPGSTVWNDLFNAAFLLNDALVFEALFELINRMLNAESDLTADQINAILRNQHFIAYWAAMKDQPNFDGIYNHFCQILIRLVKEGKLSALECHQLFIPYQILSSTNELQLKKSTFEITVEFFKDIIQADPKITKEQAAVFYNSDAIRNALKVNCKNEIYLKAFSQLNNCLLSLQQAEKLEPDTCAAISSSMLFILPQVAHFSNVHALFASFCKNLPRNTLVHQPGIATVLLGNNDNLSFVKTFNLDLKAPGNHIPFIKILSKLVKTGILSGDDCLEIIKTYNLFELGTSTESVSISDTDLAAEIYLALLVQSKNLNSSNQSYMQEIFKRYAAIAIQNNNYKPACLVGLLLSKDGYRGRADFENILKDKVDVKDFILAIKDENLQYYFLKRATSGSNSLHAFFDTARFAVPSIEQSCGEYAGKAVSGFLSFSAPYISSITQKAGLNIHLLGTDPNHGCLGELNAQKEEIDANRKKREQMAINENDETEGFFVVENEAKGSPSARISTAQGQLPASHHFAGTQDRGSSSRTSGVNPSLPSNMHRNSY
jgi:hypothetical protein